MSNQHLVDLFEQLRQDAATEGSKGRIIHYNRVIKVLRDLPTVRSIDDVKGIKGVGPKTINAIAEVLEQSKKHKPNEDEDEADDDSGGTMNMITESVKPSALAGLLLAQSFDSDKHDPKGWYMSEKLDGVRAYWDGHSHLWSRLQNRFYAPKWFTDALPRGVPLDGELYCGRGNFQDAVSIVRSQTPDTERWRTVRYCVFDTPDDGTQTFEERFEHIREHIGENHAIVDIVKHDLCRDHGHLHETLNTVVDDGGEGLMLRQPQSHYEGKRSKTLLKVKRTYDAEAEVIGHHEGRGRNNGRLGAMRCRMACGKEFKLGTGLTDADRDNPPPIGAIVTYSFNELTRAGVPRFPRYVRVRRDVTEAKDFVA